MQLMNDEATLKPIAEEIIAKNPKAVEDFRNGKTASLQFLFGQLMGRTKGKADPDVAKKILTDLLS
jgi:aspartyl-tRNA(Asn)/glutamyl-tRNA(Gln) amidotransferase subunit B